MPKAKIPVEEEEEEEEVKEEDYLRVGVSVCVSVCNGVHVRVCHVITSP